MELLVFGGKGGVGKSSISTATAVKLSQLAPDKKILLISFDIAHNLSDLFQKEVGNTLTQITDNLYAIEPDADKYAEEYTRSYAEKMRALAKSMPLVGKIPSLEEFIEKTFTVKSIPLSLRNSMFFQRILDAEEEIKGIDDGYSDELTRMKFDYVVADFPPTGNMIALFEVPKNTVQVLLKYSLQTMGQVADFMKGLKKVTKVFNPFGLTKPTEEQRNLSKEIYEGIISVEKRGERVTQLLRTKGSLRLVSIAEKPSFEEIKRGCELVKDYINLDAIHINRVIEKKYAEHCEMCNIQRTNQDKYISAINNHFKGKKIWLSHRLTREPIGIEGLSMLADEVYGKDATLDEILHPNSWSNANN